MTHIRLAIMFALVLCAPAGAQTPPATPSPDPPPLRVGPVTIAGFVQADALGTADDDLDEVNNMFRMRRARVGVSGDVAQKIGWALSVELISTPHVRDAYMNIRFAEQFQLRFGQFYPIYSLERMTSSSRLELIDRSRMVEAMTYERNPGVMVLNARPYGGWISYALGAFNGTGMNRADNNDAKDVIGRVVITPPMLRGLALGISGGAGEQPDGDRNRAGADVSFNRGPVKIAIEALREDHGPEERDGFYVLGAYRIVAKQVRPHFRMAEIAARYVRFNDPFGARPPAPTRSFLPATTEEVQFGGNYHVNRNVRFMANVIVPVDERDTPGATAIGRLQIMF